MIQIHNQTPITLIRDEQQSMDKAKLIQLEAELAATKEENIIIMEATAFLYEELQALKGGSSV